MNNDLRTQFIAVFALGYIEEMAGREVTIEDEIDVETAAEIQVAALACVERLETEEMKHPPSCAGDTPPLCAEYAPPIRRRYPPHCSGYPPYAQDMAPPLQQKHLSRCPPGYV